MPNKTRANRARQGAGPTRIENWLRLHARVARASWQRLLASPVSSLLTVVVMAVSLLLPALLFTLDANLSRLLSDFQQRPQIALYLSEEVSDSEALQISKDLLTEPGIESVEYISRAQGLAEFSVASGLGQILAQLPENPLPATLLVYPQTRDPALISALAAALQTRAGVQLAQVDSEWLLRLEALSNLVSVVGSALALIVVVGLFVSVGNTIKLAIENRRKEISVIKLVGGTDAYVIRPLLYSGVLFGGAGATLGLLLLKLFVILVNAPLQDLLGLYDASFTLQGLGWGRSLLLLATGCLIGWVAALFTGLRYVRDLGP